MSVSKQMTRESFRPPDHEHDQFLLTTVVGSFPRPSWLEGLASLSESDAVREEVWETALDDACQVVLLEHERTGLDVVGDGEVRREDMIDYFAARTDGMDLDAGSSGWNAHMPTVVGPVSAAEPWLADDLRFAAAHARRPVKTTVTGPFTLASFCSLEGYDDVPTLARDFADVVGGEVARLADAGARWIQLDEPALGMSPHVDLGRECIERVADHAPDDVRLGLHVCSGNYDELLPDLLSFPVDEVDLEFASDDADPIDRLGEYDLPVDLGVGVVDTQKKAVESVAEIRANVERAVSVVPPDQLTLTPDCGMKPLPREAAVAKLRNLATAAREVEAALDAGEIGDVRQGSP